MAAQSSKFNLIISAGILSLISCIAHSEMQLSECINTTVQKGAGDSIAIEVSTEKSIGYCGCKSAAAGITVTSGTALLMKNTLNTLLVPNVIYTLDSKKLTGQVKVEATCKDNA